MSDPSAGSDGRLPLAVILLAVFTHVLWGGNPVAIKIGLEAFPPFISAALRFALAIACIALWARFKGIAIWPERGEWRGLWLLGVLFLVQIGLMYVAIDLTTSVMAAVLVATYPLFSSALGHFFISGDRLDALKTLGLLISFAGVAAVLISGTDISALNIADVGNLLMLLSSALLGARLTFSARLLTTIDPVRVGIWQMVIAMLALAVTGAFVETVNWEAVGWWPILGIVYQGAVIAGFGFTVNFILMQRYSPSVIVAFGFISPLSGVVLGAWLLQEPLTPALGAGAVAVAIGLALLSRQARARS